MKTNLTLSFIAYSEIAKLKSVERVKKILDIILKGKIVILQGRLDATEEGSLIQSTMALVGRVKDFKGVELAVINPNQNQGTFDKLKSGLAHALIGQRDSLTIIGPASLIKEVKKDPSKIELMLKK
jgi:hypothetical protein